MTEPQVWVLIGVFAAAMFGMIGIVTAGFNRNLDSKFAIMAERFERVESNVSSRIEALDAKFSAKLDLMDADIQAISRHVFGSDPR